MSYEGILTAVFTHPNIGTVGLTEAEARRSGSAVRIFRSEFRPLKHIEWQQRAHALMKLVVDATTDRVLGVHGWRRCWRDRAGLCGSAQGRCDQGGVRRHRWHPPDSGGRIYHHARAGWRLIRFDIFVDISAFTLNSHSMRAAYVFTHEVDFSINCTASPYPIKLSANS